MTRLIPNKLKLFVFHLALSLIKRKLEQHLCRIESDEDHALICDSWHEVLSVLNGEGPLEGSSGETSRSKSVSSSTSSP